MRHRQLPTPYDDHDVIAFVLFLGFLVLGTAATGISAKAKRANEVRVRQARQEMVAALEEINRRFHISAYDPLGLDKDPFQAEKESGLVGARTSDSNRQELRPNLRPRI